MLRKVRDAVDLLAGYTPGLAARVFFVALAAAGLAFLIYALILKPALR